MGETSIEWARYTFNPWRGCTKVSPGCDHCYAETMSHRNPKVLGIWGDEGVRAMAAESYWNAPLKWAAQARALGKRDRVFCASLADVGEDRPELLAPRARLCDLIDRTADGLIWMLLTKRIENMARLFPKETLGKCGVGVTTEDQERLDQRAPHLLKTHARWRFISAEPLLSHLNLRGYCHPAWVCPTCFEFQSVEHEACRKCGVSNEWNDIVHGIDLVIAGGETNGRPCHPDWFRSLQHQCATEGVAFFLKQWGDWLPAEDNDDGNEGFKYPFGNHYIQVKFDDAQPHHLGAMMHRVGKHAAGRLLDGREWNQMPEAAR